MADFDALSTLDSLPDAVVATDGTQHIVYANPGVERLLGWKPEELRGRLLAALFPPPHQDMPLGQPLIVRAKRPNGAVLPVELTLTGDAEVRLVATLREPPDASARKLRAILETISVGVLLAEGPEGRLTISNPEAERIAGEPIRADSYADFVAKFPLERLDGRALDLKDRPLSRTMDQGKPVREMLKFQRRDGREFVLEVTTAPFSNPDGGAVTTFLDVTERIQLQQDLADRANQLTALIDHLPVGVAYFDKMAVCRVGNNPAKRFLGRRSSEINGATADELFAAAPVLRDALHRCVRDNTPHIQERVAWPDAQKPGSIRYLDWQFQPLNADSAKPRGALALIIDVTERARAEAEKQQAMEAAEGASRRKTQFLSAVSHDLRTPVNALSLQAELLGRIVEMRADPDDDLQLLAGDIRAASNNLIELINDLLDLTRLDSGGFDYKPTDFSLDAWLAATLAPLELTARTKALEFAWNVDRPGRIIHGDRVKLGRVLTNLVGNAVKFTEDGEVTISVFADRDGCLRIEVCDTGPGIPADQIEHIFDEFSQLRNPERDRTKGTGLGLAICRRLVEGVGGQMLVESEVGRGSTFTAIYPPEHLPPTKQPEIPELPGNAATISAAHDAFATILLVEDDDACREEMAQLLQDSGYSVHATNSGTPIIEAIRQSRPSLVLLDLMLPGVDGSDVLRQIRREPATKRLKVVVITGDMMSARTDELQALDVEGILAKPVETELLLELLGDLLPKPAARNAAGA